jgi:hypothetical protein
MEKTQLIRDLLNKGKANVVYELACGISPYSIDYAGNTHMEPQIETLWQLAINHLEFIAKYGSEIEMIEVGKRMYFPHPTEFELWLEAGAVGITGEELRSYLQANPNSL